MLVDWRTANGTSSYASLSDLTEARGYEADGQHLTGDDELFVDAADGDYRVSRESPAAGSGRPLPDEVAEVLGAEPGSVLDRGARRALDSPA